MLGCIVLYFDIFSHILPIITDFSLHCFVTFVVTIYLISVFIFTRTKHPAKLITVPLQFY